MKNGIRKLFSVILSVSLLASFGTIYSFASDNKIHISTYDELDAVRNNLSGNYILDNNIEIPTGENFVPIGSFVSPFYGNFDGNSYSVSGLSINKTSLSEDVVTVGLFVCVTGNIDNLSVNGTINCSFTTENTIYSGLIAGCLKSRGKIQNCTASGSIIILSEMNSFPVCVGGISGTVINSNIINCLNTASVSTCISQSYSNTIYTGGISGYTFCTNIIECSNEAEITVQNNNVVTNNTEAYLFAGGIVGYENNKTVIDSSFNVGDITASGETSVYKNVGGIAGMIYKSSVMNSYTIGIITGAENTDAGSFCGVAQDADISRSYVLNSNISICSKGSCNVIEATSYQMSDEESLGLLDFSLTWKFDSSIEYPYPILKKTSHGALKFNPLCGMSDYIPIYDYNDLLSVADAPSEDYVLMNDIALSPSQSIKSFIADTFSGTFYGNNHSINNINFSGDNPGLFKTNNGNISGLTLEILSFSDNTGNVSAGLIAQYNSGKISECYADVSSSVISASSIIFGGLTVENTGTIEHCSFTAQSLTLNADSVEFGGITMLNGQGGRTGYCTVSGILTASTGQNAYSHIFAGAAVNENEGGIVYNCSTNMNFNLTTSTHHSRIYSAGISAQNYGEIRLCDVSGNISAYSFGNTYIGGIAGTNEEGTIIDCRALSDLEAVLTSPGYIFSISCGGISGRSSGMIVNSFAYNSIETSVVSDKSSQEYTGGLVGYNHFGIIENCYYNNSSESATGYTSSNEQIACSFATNEQLSSGEVAYELGYNFGMIISNDYCPQFYNSENRVYKFETNNIWYENRPYNFGDNVVYREGYLMGLRTGLGINDIYEYIVPAVGFTLLKQDDNSHIGTGCEITVCDENEGVTDSFTTVIYGDVNSDSYTDAQDSVIIRAILGGLLTADDITAAQHEALDCNHDGAVDNKDVELLNNAGLFIEAVDQYAS